MSRNTRLPSLDGIRAVCITLVVGAHARRSIGFPESWKTPSDYLFHGHLGVLVFFVLSGFLITYLLCREESVTGRISLSAFYTRRFLRIIPVYLAYVAVVVAIDAFTQLDVSACQYFTTLTYTKNYACGSWIDAHLWSLSVEEQFYLAWPILLMFLSARGRRRAAALLVISVPFFRLAFDAYLDPRWVQQATMTNMDSLMIGSALGMLLATRPVQLDRALSWNTTPMRGLCAAVIYGVWMLELHDVAGAFVVTLGKTVQAAAAGYLIASYARIKGGPIFAFLNLRPVQYVGVLSYSLYIWQQPFFDGLVAEWLPGPPVFMTFPLNIVAAFAVAACSYHLLEMPLLRLRARFRPLEKAPNTEATPRVAA